MTDSPVPRAPLNPAEQPILDSLLNVRDRLELLRKDKSTYVKSRDIIDAYNQVIAQARALSVARNGKRTEETRGAHLVARPPARWRDAARIRQPSFGVDF